MSEVFPKESWLDTLHTGGRALVSAIPFVGGPAVEFLNSVIAPPVQARREQWLNDIGDRVEMLEREGHLTIQALRDNEEFISTFLQATMAAQRNHKQEKIEALRNAVLNTAVGKSPPDAKREMFLVFVDVFTVLHLQLLQAFSLNDQKAGKIVKMGLNDIAKMGRQLVAELRKEEAWAEVIVEDLCRKGLLHWNGGQGIASYIPQGMNQVSELGVEFLRFITQP